MTRDEVIVELKSRIRNHLSIPRGLEGTSQGKIILLDNIKDIQFFVYKNTNELLALCTDFWGENFVDRIYRELNIQLKEDVKNVCKKLGIPEIEF